ncbi:Uncharacterized protein APZ42_014938 [Daphnia magna]|uniref:Uncharacterized protein n=1 Tax=Daphnia magna TaxID=35525 RepID=A0A162P0X1_9CRUS|nr:Uncharacterized protein APZ42_014938 [Daphnia magna]
MLSPRGRMWAKHFSSVGRLRCYRYRPKSLREVRLFLIPITWHVSSV